MATTHKSYYERVRRELNLALCVQNFPCQNVERHNKPEVEFQDSPELVLPPVEVTRNDNERVLIERSINSARVSVKVKQADELEEILCRQFTRFLTQRAEAFKVLRRVPVPGYDVSFLVTHEHVEDMLKPKLVDFIVQLLEDVDREISEQKLSVSSRGRVVAADFLKSFA
jgi:actin related protein 2/3 complex subunit 4